jgi:hypothetical protein
MRRRGEITPVLRLSSYKISADRQDPLDLENLLVDADVLLYAARDSNPEPAG